MFSILGIIIIVSYLVSLLVFLLNWRHKQYQFFLLNAAIIINIFVGFGTAVMGIGFVTLSSLLYNTTVIALNINKLSVNRKSSVAFIILMIVLFISLINLVCNPYMPDVILMDTSMDSVYYGVGSVEKAVLSRHNISALKDIIMMCIALILSLEFFKDKNYLHRLLCNIRKAFYVYFVIITFEFIVNNLMTPSVLRNMVYLLVGIDTSSLSKIWTAENRFGYYGVTGLFSEQSYISVMLIFFTIVYVQGVKTKKELFGFIYSIFALIMSGCTTGLALIPFAMIIYIKDILKKEKGERKSVRALKWSVFVGAFLVCLYICLFNIDIFAEIWIDAYNKISALLKGGYYNTSPERSAAIRNFGNSIAWKAFFESPLLGVGIGTTRGYGILSGLFANFGILGVAAYLYFLNTIFDFRIKKKAVLLIIVILYSSILLSVWYSYYFAWIPLYAAFGVKEINNSTLIRKNIDV